VVPGEDPAAWQAHREGVLASLAPVGLLELTLAERVALLSWRLARVARYEAAGVAAGVEDAGLPPPDADPFARGACNHVHPAETARRFAEQEARRAREDLAAVAPEAYLLRRLRCDDGVGPLPAGPALGVLCAAHGLAAECPLPRFRPAHPPEPAFLARLGVAGQAAQDVPWTRDLVLAGLGYYAEAAGRAGADFRAEVQDALDGRAAEFARAVDRLETDAAAHTRRVVEERGRAAAAALLPPERVADRIVKFERHLHGLLTSTLHELERLQARRAGWPVALPAAADLTVTVTQD
jgi:hypothetical protein